MSTVHEKVIRAAGALLWRDLCVGYEIAIIHRRRYDDWTLPKGKLNDSESSQAAALREVKEETGYDATIRGFAGAIAYQTDQASKVVHFWHMIANGDSASDLDDEVAEVLWLPVEAARRRVQYPLEQVLLETWNGPDELADTG